MCLSSGTDAPLNGLIVYRLVDAEHDEIEVGKRLIRISDHSNQKYGPAMYFTLTREDGLKFAKAQQAKREHGHKYTHLLTCRIENASLGEFVDLRATPNIMVSGRFRNMRTAERAAAFCGENGQRGVIWQSHASLNSPEWTELCLYPEHVGNNVLIVASEAVGS